MKSVICILLVAITATFSFNLKAQTSYYWNASSGNWNNSANWSAGSPGASSNGKYPHSTDTVYIEGSSNATITLNVNDTIVNLIISGSGSFFINTSNSSVVYVLNNLTSTNTSSSGGGTATIEMWGTIAQTITGGSTDGVGKLPNLTLANRSGGVTLYNDLTMGGSTTLTLASGTSASCNSSSLINFYYSNTITGSWTFNNVEFQGTSSAFTFSNTITVNGYLKTSGSASCVLNSSTVSLNGNLLVYNSCSGSGGGGSAVINLTGSTNQQIYSNSTTEGVGFLPIVRINKTADSLSLQGVISIQGEWSNYYSTSKVNCGTAELCFYNPNLTSSIGGSYPTPIYRLAFGYIGAPSNATYSLTCDSALIVLDSTKLQGNQLCTINNHSIKANGSIIVRNGWGGAGTATFFIGGSNAQSLISKEILGGGGLPGITILKTGGSLSLYGIVTVAGGWINNFSNTGVIAGSSTMYIFLANGSVTVGGMHPTTFYNLTFGGGSNCTYNFNEDSALIVTDTFLLNSPTHTLSLNNDSIFVLGPVINAGNGGSGTTTLTLIGSSNQIIKSPSTLGWFPSITIHKGGGTVSLLGQIGVWTNWINNYSKTEIVPGTATLYFGIPSSTSTSTWGGSAPTPVYKVVLENGNCTFNLTHDSALIILDTLLISSGTSSTYSMTGNALVIEGNVVNSKAYAPTFSNTWIFKGANNQTISGANGLTLHNMTVTKSAGTVTLKQPVNISNLLTFSKGIIKDTLTELLTINNGASVTGASDSGYVAGDVKKIGNAAFKFPVGGNNHYRPLTMSAPSTTTDAFTAGYNYATPPSGTLGSGVTQLDSCENWYFNHASGSSSVKVGLHTTHSCFKFFSKYHLTVGYLNGSWTSGGAVSIGGDSIMVTSGLSNWGSGNSLTIAKTNPLVTATAASNASICYGASTSVGGSSGTGGGGMGTLSYAWSPATGLSSATAANPTATPTSTTTYAVTVTDTVGEYNTASTVVTVNPLPSNTTGGNKSVCAGSGTAIGATSTTGHIYSWSPSTGLSSTTASNPTASPTITTTYTLTETITATGCSAANGIVVTVNSLPGDNEGSNQTICSGTGATIGAASTSGHTYSWSSATGLSNVTLSDPVASPTVTTTYTLTETITATGCSVSNSMVVTVHPSPAVHAGDDTTIYAPLFVYIGGTATGGTPPYAYSWSPSTALSSSTVSDPVASPTVTTSYVLTVTDSNSCIGKDTITVTVAPVPLDIIERVEAAQYIFEGQVISSQSYWDSAHRTIFTSNIIQISKILKGSLTCGTVELITQGGIVDSEAVLPSHALNLVYGNEGIFLCNTTNWEPPTAPAMFLYNTQILGPPFEQQSFIKYWWDGEELQASDLMHRYGSLDNIYTIVSYAYPDSLWINCSDETIFKKQSNGYQQNSRAPKGLDKSIVQVIQNNKSRSDSTKKQLLRGINITYSMVFDSITTVNNQNLEFDVYANSSASVQFQTGDIELQYDPATFGSYIYDNYEIDVTQEGIISSGIYSVTTSDVSSDVVDISVAASATDTSSFGLLPAGVDELLFHVKVKLADCISSDIAFTNITTMQANSVYCITTTTTTTTTFDSTVYTSDTTSIVESFTTTTTSSYFYTFDDVDTGLALPCTPSCAPHINGFSPLQVDGGIGDVLTITGYNFGSTQGTGNLYFPNADDGGLSEIVLDPIDLAWSDTLITVIVPSYNQTIDTGGTPITVPPAPVGTGAFRIVTNSGLQDTTGTSLTVFFSVTNHPAPTKTKMRLAGPQQFGTDTFGYKFEVDTNIWRHNRRRACIKQALKAWNCLTGVNWVLDTSFISVNDTSSFFIRDHHNFIHFGNPHANYRGALMMTSPHTMKCSGKPFVDETDIVINPSVAWYYDTTISHNIPYGYFDFYHAILHELGHAQCLSHVIDPNALMYYSETDTGTPALLRAVNLDVDLSAGNGGVYVMDSSISVTPHDCDSGTLNPMVAIYNCRPFAYGIESLTNQDELIVFPNPADNEVTIDFWINSDNKTEFDLFNMYGQELYSLKSNEVHTGSNSISLFVQNYPAGVYLLHSLVNGKYYENKIVHLQ